MAVIKTTDDFGTAIRARRQELGWDQARLAKQMGVSRQWVIEIEKGKPRVALDLVMRAVGVLGLSLSLATPESLSPRKFVMQRYPSIDEILSRATADRAMSRVQEPPIASQLTDLFTRTAIRKLTFELAQTPTKQLPEAIKMATSGASMKRAASSGRFVEASARPTSPGKKSPAKKKSNKTMTPNAKARSGSASRRKAK